jgi:hypothetical protein
MPVMSAHFPFTLVMAFRFDEKFYQLVVCGGEFRDGLA